MKVLKTILAFAGVIWGFLIVLTLLLTGLKSAPGNSAYQAGYFTGQVFGGVLGVVIFIAGLRYLLRMGKRSD